MQRMFLIEIKNADPFSSILTFFKDFEIELIKKIKINRFYKKKLVKNRMS